MSFKIKIVPISVNECEQLWASHAVQALDARLTNHVVAPSVNPA